MTSKLNTLSTNEDEKKEECANAFIDVLGCSKTEASFYLESTEWNLESAVMLWLENNTTSSSSGYGNGGSNSRYSYNHLQAPVMAHLTNGYSSYASQNKKYEPREVRIAGLPDDWKAVVNENSGNVQFVHVPTGFLQNNVPPGYADRVDDDEVYGSDCDNASRKAVRGGRRGGRKGRNGDGMVDMTSGDGDDLDLDDDEGDLDDDLASDNCDDEDEDAAVDLDTSMTAVDGDVNRNERRRSGVNSQQTNRRKIFAPKVGRGVTKADDDVLNTSFVRSDTEDMANDDEVVAPAVADCSEMNDTSDL